MTTFSANPIELEKVRRKKNHETVSSVLFVLFFVGLLMVYTDAATVWEIAFDMRTEPSSVRSFLIFLMVAAAFMEILSIVTAVLFTKRYKSLSDSKLVLENSGIRGMHFSSVDAQGVPFFVPYEEVERAYANGSSDALNLTIFCKNRSYQCFAIAGAHVAADQINEICQSGKTSQQTEARATDRRQFAPVHTLKCPVCGQDGQAANRTCCWRCGTPFEK